MNKIYTQNSVNNNVAPTLDTRCDCLGVVVKDDNIYTEESKKRIIDNIVKNDYVNVITANAMQSFNHNNCHLIKEEQMEKDNIVTATLDEYNHKINGPETIGTIQAMYPVQNHGHRVIENPLRIRKLTPTECFRLMGVKNEDSSKLDHLSNSTKYHLAGDSIVVNVLQAIFKSVLIDNPVLENKPIRLIEFFAGYGSQALALKYLGIPFESWKICEWAFKSTDAYKHIHHFDDHIDYSNFLSKEDLVSWLYEKGISSNWNKYLVKKKVN